MSMMIHEYHCSVCEGSFGTRKEWLSHLLEPNHQTKARKEISRWTQPERECVLIAFTTFPIASLNLLQFFSKGCTDLVTDFVWFTNRPQMGLVQFESKHKVEEILSSFGGPEIRFDNQLVQVRSAGECLPLEWQLMTHWNPSALDEEFESISDSDAQKLTSRPVISVSLNKAVVEKASKGRKGQQVKNLTQQLEEVYEREAKPVHSLVDDYRSICHEIEIPDEEYETAQQFLQALETECAKRIPGCRLIWFRNWYLKLRKTSPLNELIFFFDHMGIYTALATNPSEKLEIGLNNGIRPMEKMHVIRRAFLKAPYAKDWGIVKAKAKMCPGLLFDNYRRNFRCQKNGFVFSVVNQTIMLPEIQACHLVSYLCSFDARVKPLLTLIRYWAKSNGIALAKSGKKIVLGHPPDPAALDWLVIFFLTHKQKILPTAREITERPHPKLLFDRVDIGFAEDPSFAKQYSSRYEVTNEEVHVFNIFSLAKMFFTFYSNLLVGNRKLVFNMKDAEIISGDESLGAITAIKSKLVKSERHHARIKRLGKGAPNTILLHPLYLRHGLSFRHKAFVTSVRLAMEVTAENLKQELDNYKNGRKFDMKSALKVK